MSYNGTKQTCNDCVYCSYDLTSEQRANGYEFYCTKLMDLLESGDCSACLQFDLAEDDPSEDDPAGGEWVDAGEYWEAADLLPEDDAEEGDYQEVPYEHCVEWATSFHQQGCCLPNGCVWDGTAAPIGIGENGCLVWKRPYVRIGGDES